jgi:hypothetical protein
VGLQDRVPAEDLIGGGAWVICYWRSAKDHIYLVYGYLKGRRDDLTRAQIKILAELMKDMKHG